MLPFFLNGAPNKFSQNLEHRKQVKFIESGEKITCNKVFIIKRVNYKIWTYMYLNFILQLEKGGNEVVNLFSQTIYNLHSIQRQANYYFCVH